MPGRAATTCTLCAGDAPLLRVTTTLAVPLAVPAGSTFQGTLPIARKYKVAAYNWGLVAGKTQTYLPWDSWQKPYTDREPAVWFHEIFQKDGTPYRQEEADFIRQTIGSKVKGKRAKAAPAH